MSSRVVSRRVVSSRVESSRVESSRLPSVLIVMQKFTPQSQKMGICAGPKAKGKAAAAQLRCTCKDLGHCRFSSCNHPKLVRLNGLQIQVLEGICLLSKLCVSRVMIVLLLMVFRANPKKAFVFQLVVVKGIPLCQSVFRIVLVCLVKPITSSLIRVLWSDLLGLMLSRMDLVSFGFQAVNRTMFVILLRLFRMSLFSKASLHVVPGVPAEAGASCP